MYYESGGPPLSGDKAFEARVRMFEFFATIDFTKLRGCVYEERLDGDGEMALCVTIPMLKNGIKFEGKHKYRVVLGALRCNGVQAATHILVPVVSKRHYGQMITKGYKFRYDYILPYYGEVIKDITDIPLSPLSYHHPNSRLNPAYNINRKYIQGQRIIAANAVPNRYSNIHEANLVKPNITTPPQQNNYDLRANILNMTKDANK